MSSEFLPVNMRRITTDDNAYQRQNQYGTNGKAAKASGFSAIVPSNDEIKASVNNAMQMIAKSSYPDRGSILNILV